MPTADAYLPSNFKHAIGAFAHAPAIAVGDVRGANAVNDGSNDDRPRSRAAGSAPPRDTVMLDGVQLYLEGAAAAVIMAALGAISGLATFASTDDQRLALLVAAGAFTLTGIILTVRLWRMTRAVATPTEPPA